MPFSARKMHFLTKMSIWPPAPRSTTLMSRNFFSGGNFTPIFEAKKVGTAGQKCPMSQFSPNFWRIWKKKFPKRTWTKDILCMLPKYIIIHGFRSPLGQKMPWFWPKTIIFHFSKIDFFGCFKGFWRSNWNSKTSFMIW